MAPNTTTTFKNNRNEPDVYDKLSQYTFPQTKSPQTSCANNKKPAVVSPLTSAPPTFKLDTTTLNTSPRNYSNVTSLRRPSNHRRSFAVSGSGGSTDLDSLFSAKDGRGSSTSTASGSSPLLSMVSSNTNNIGTVKKVAPVSALGHHVEFKDVDYLSCKNKGVVIDLSPASIEPKPSVVANRSSISSIPLEADEFEDDERQKQEEVVDIVDFLKESASETSLVSTPGYDHRNYIFYSRDNGFDSE